MRRMKQMLHSRHAGLLALLALLICLFGAYNESFRDPLNLLDRSRYWVETGLLMVPMTFIIATGGIDLSVGSLMALSAVCAGVCMNQLHLPLHIAIPAGVLAGICGGALNGLIISRLGVPPLVTTLATMALFRGLAMGISQATPVRDLPEAFTEWGGLGAIMAGSWPIPHQLLFMLAVVALGEILFRRNLAGRWSLQLGENPVAARFTGIPVRRLRFLLYLASGACCGLAGVLSMARFATAHPAAGGGLELEVIACVVIGGTRITGGSGSVLGSLLGLLILGLLRFGLDMAGMVQQRQIILIGMLVVAAAVFNEMISRIGERSPRLKRTLVIQ